jgi:hypothetical protein
VKFSVFLLGCSLRKLDSETHPLDSRHPWCFRFKRGDTEDRIPGKPKAVDCIAKYDEDTILTGIGDGYVRALDLYLYSIYNHCAVLSIMRSGSQELLKEKTESISPMK